MSNALPIKFRLKNDLNVRGSIEVFNRLFLERVLWMMNQILLKS